MGASLINNARFYVLFSVFFTARAYYPVLAILFIDIGLSLDQFVMLNLIWAATIFLFEVPSGALADTLGRRSLLVAAASLMIIEMSCLLLAPLFGGIYLLAFCVINRICSGLSEACASGADEALAYDSLPDAGRADAWDKLLSRVMRWRSIGFVVAMIVGGLVYDPTWVNRLLPSDFQISEAVAHRIPVVIVLLQALMCFWFALMMKEPPRHMEHGESTLKGAFALTLRAAYWALTHKKILVVIVVGLAIDSIVRNFATINSSYYRLIDLPEWSYGFLGAALGALGWFVPGWAARLNNRFSLMTNLLILSAIALVGLWALTPAWPYLGLIPAMLVMSLMWFLGFTVSRVLHAETSSSMRATVLSVKGLVFNLGYGLFSLGFGQVIAHYAYQSPEQSLKSALIVQVPFFAVFISVLLVWAFYFLPKKSQ